ncbi:MAG: MBL fold metallo-hydrolase [Nanoarchaeota archaeon]|nr:MBL fold metallo-hydrolase [Nanoarchaeota archaeon]MCG2717794.1 MBL fold metallo-hydrolase [Nanoarchaeota archaeon]
MAKKTLDNQINLGELGAAERVAGSKLLLKVGKQRYLTDIGKEYREGEDEEPLEFNPERIDHLILTHGHADHMGAMLKMTTKGYDGKIYSTKETADITDLQLNQQISSPFIHNRMVKGKRYKAGPRKGQWVSFQKILYQNDDRKKAMAQFASSDGETPGYDYGENIKLSKDVDITFYDAGHIPGSAQILFNINHKGEKRKLLTAYDLGRTDYKILRHPVANIPIVRYPHKDFPKSIDYIVVESTYGDKVHTNIEDSIKILEDAAKDAAKKKGKLIIPAFSVMRTHILLSFLYMLEQEGRLPKDMMFYSSSPMADKVSKIILNHLQNVDEQSKKDFADPDYNPFKFDKLINHKKIAETRELLKSGTTPWGIVASSGMCEAGRIVPILEQTLNDPKNIVLITGYAAYGTKAYMMIKGEKKIPFANGMIDVKADIRRMGGLSGHADKKEIIAHLKNIRDPEDGKQFKGIFIKHGEKDACYKLKDSIIEAGYNPKKVHVMIKDEPYVL